MNTIDERKEWIVDYNKGVFNYIRNISPGDDDIFSDSFKKTLKKDAEPGNDTEGERDHLIVKSLKEYQSILQVFKYELVTGEWDDKKIHESYACKQTEKMLKSFTDLNKYLETTKGLSAKYLKGTMKSICGNKIADVTPKNIARRIDSINGEISNLIINLDAENRYSHTFVNDYNRVAFSSSFRRLQDKAQVFPLEIHDYARTRLTHTLEVAGIGKEIANLAAAKLYSENRNKKEKMAFSFEKVLECAALLHDMGNPPYGHYGEDAIKKYFRENWDSLEVVVYGGENSFDENGEPKRKKLSDILKEDKDYEQIKADFQCFDGNAQALRVATKLQWYKHTRPLELSSAILGAIIKYPYNSATGRKKEKCGYFKSEEDVIKRLTALGTYKACVRNPISILLEAADDISYITSDLDDGVKKKVITKEVFDIEIALYKKSHRSEDGDIRVHAFFKDYEKFYDKSVEEGAHDPFSYTIKRMINKLKKQLVLEASDFFVMHFDEITKGIGYDGSTSSGKNPSDKKKWTSILKKVESKPIIDWINGLFHKYLYVDTAITREEVKGEVIIKTLLDEFTKSILSLDFTKDKENDELLLGHIKEEQYGKMFFREEKIYGLISPNFRDVFLREYEKAETEAMRNYYKLRLVVDFVSGMTDSYAWENYKALKGI